MYIKSRAGKSALPLAEAEQDSYAKRICLAADDILAEIDEGKKLTTSNLSRVMRAHFGSAAAGGWTVKDSHEACEVALVKRIRQGTWALGFGEASPADVRKRLADIQGLLPTHSGRTEESVLLQQFSTPLELGYLASLAADVSSDDILLEPSAGTGLLAAVPSRIAASLILNEISDRRADILRHLYGQEVFQYNAEQIDNFLPPSLVPTVAMLNPPFSASPGIERRNAIATLRHLTSTIRRVQSGGRIALISAHWFHPDNPEWRDEFVKLQRVSTLLLSVPLPGKAYQRHGTHIDTRLTVFDKLPAANPSLFEGVCQRCDLNEAFELVRLLPPRRRLSVGVPGYRQQQPPAAHPKATPESPIRQVTSQFADVEPITYSAKPSSATTEGDLKDSIFERYSPQAISIAGAQEHPSKLCESAAMSSVRPPLPSYSPRLPKHLIANGILSEAQIEAIVYAGDAHSKFLKGKWLVSDDLETITSAPHDQLAKQFRQGYFLGDGTGTGKGRQVAGMIVDNWVQGRTKAVWISEKATLIEDARRDWAALGGDPADIFSLSKFPQGASIPAEGGILFTTYATLRSQGRNGKKSRLQQILDWLTPEFDGLIAFDECHAMGGALKGETVRGQSAGSLQGRSGIMLQNGVPAARIVYVSATGATRVESLAYANRLGLWGTGSFPFVKRQDFVNAICDAGVSAMELVARDLKALGLYMARTLSYDGIEYAPLVVELSPEQEEVYNTCAAAYEVIHNHLEEALEETNSKKNSQTHSAAISAFESAKLRFFEHLIIGLKTPTLIKSIEKDLAAGRSVLISLISTNEAIINRRLSSVDPSEWDDLSIDLSPREIVIDYIKRCFPIQAHEEYQDGDAILSRPIYDGEGNPVIDQCALRIRESLIEKMLFLPPVLGALEQILWHFGHDMVAEVTGRRTRVLMDQGSGRLYVSTRNIHAANLAETKRFMDGEKRILIFSDAGGTGRSYHADLNCKNQQQRRLYLLQTGWRADKATQALGRVHRTNSRVSPIISTVGCSSIPGEKRFVSTIAKRLFAMGALTRGQRQAAGDNIFSARDDLESEFAKAALHGFLRLMADSKFEECGPGLFQKLTGLRLLTEAGQINTSGIPISRFMNRLLALTLDMQRILFAKIDQMIEYNINMAIDGGMYDRGVETLKGHSFTIVSERVINVHPDTGAQTQCLEVKAVSPISYRNPYEERDRYRADNSNVSGFDFGVASQMVINDRSGHAAILHNEGSMISPTGVPVRRFRLVRPKKDDFVKEPDYRESSWRQANSSTEWLEAWQAEIKKSPKTVTSRFFLVTGLLLPIWFALDNAGFAIVARLKTDDGQIYLGRKIEADQMPKITRALGIKTIELEAGELIGQVMNGDGFDLGNGMRLKRSRLRDEYRPEIVGYISQGLSSRLVHLGVIKEIIGYHVRHFLPLTEDGPQVLDAIRHALRTEAPRQHVLGSGGETFNAKHGELHPSVIDALERSTSVGNRLYLPERLERNLYMAVRQVVETLQGTWQKEGYHLFPPSIDLQPMMEEIIATGTLPPKNPLAFFRTPQDIAQAAVEWLELECLHPSATVWEPSCGDGALLKALQPHKQQLGLFVYAHELDPGRAAQAKALGIADVMTIGDCLLAAEPDIPAEGFDRILLNPPFSGRGRRYLYATHILHALHKLKPGGILVAIAPISLQTATAGIPADLHEQINGGIIPLPDKAFHESGTDVKTVLLRIYR